MKKKLFLLPLLTAFSLAGCSLTDLFSGASTQTTESNNEVKVDESLETTQTGSVEYVGSAYDVNSAILIENPEEITVTETTDPFSIKASDGATFSQEGSVVTITSAGTFTLSGKLEGQILVNAGDDDVVEIELKNVSISYDQDSPIKVVNADEVEISAKKETENLVTDNRAHKVEDSADQFEGAISAKTDLKLKGAGKLVVIGHYNNGVHTTKDLTIQKQTIKVVGYNNAIKGKNSVTIESGTIQAFAQTGNGIKTEDSDKSSKGKQRGSITINGGSVFVSSLHDGVDAAYDVVVDEVDSEVPTAVVLKCGTKSTVYSSSNFTADSEKGLKAANNIVINKGAISIAASDDAIHANYGIELGNGESGLGNITIKDGLIKIASGDDGVHADNTLTVDGGTIYVTGAKEGLEANYIVINGGSTYVYGTDDGVNASKKSFTDCSFTMNGGYLDVAVDNGDTDGIDSNGAFTLAGGIIITRGSPGTGDRMSTGLDVDNTPTMTGGTLIAFNGLERSPTVSSGIWYAGTEGANSSNGMGGGPGGGPGGGSGGGWRGYNPGSSSSSYSFQAGEYKLSGDGVEISFKNDYSYSKFCVYSSSIVEGATYTLTRAETSVLNWTQSSSQVIIS